MHDERRVVRISATFGGIGVADCALTVGARARHASDSVAIV
jgi:hypothetical protein